MKKFLIFILGIVVGVALVFGGVAAAGYFVLSGINYGMVEDFVTPDREEGGFTEAQRSVTLMSSAKAFIDAFQNMDTITVAEFEEAVGAPLFTTLLEGLLGVAPKKIEGVLLKNVMSASIDSITIGALTNTLKIELPDFPIFSDEEFLDKGLTEAFSSFNDFTLDSFLVVVYEEDATDENPASSLLLQKMGKQTLSSLSTGMDSIINDLYLSDVIEPSEDGNSVLNKFMDIKIGELSGEADKVFRSMTLGEILTIDANSPAILTALANCAVETQTDENGNVIATSIADGIDALKLSDVITITDDTHKVLVNLQDTLIKNLGSEMSGVIDDMVLGDFVTINDDSEPILLALKDEKIGDFGTAVGNLTVGDIFKDADSGILGLIPNDTPLQDIPNQFSSASTNATLYQLKALDVYDFDDPANEITNFYLQNLTPNAMLNDFIDVLNTPATTPGPTVHNIILTGDIDFTPAYLETNNIQNGDLIHLTGAYTVTIPADTEFDIVFALQCTDDVTLAIGGNVTFRLPTADDIKAGTNSGAGTGYVYVYATNRTGEFAAGETFKISADALAPCVFVKYNP